MGSIYVLKNVFFSFSTQNHTESSGNFLKKPILDPKRAKLNQKFYVNFTESLRKCYGKFTEEYVPFVNVFL